MIYAVVLIFNLCLCAVSGPSGGFGDHNKDVREFRPHKIQEGYVPYRGAAVQGVAEQTDDHPEQHSAQLCPLYHPQP